jgi:hypothetical protein
MEAASDFAQLELRFVDQSQWRYELIRPLILTFRANFRAKMRIELSS